MKHEEPKLPIEVNESPRWVFVARDFFRQQQPKVDPVQVDLVQVDHVQDW